MRLKDVVTIPTGKLKIILTDRLTGRAISTYEDHNILVLDSKSAIVNAIAGNDQGTIYELKVGTDVGSGTEDAPEDPKESYDETTMANPYSVSTSLSIGFVDADTVSFSTTASGADMVAGLPNNGTSAIINSAALHTKNGNVFSYKRFPKKSISDAIDISFIWQIGF